MNDSIDFDSVCGGPGEDIRDDVIHNSIDLLDVVTYPMLLDALVLPLMYMLDQETVTSTGEILKCE